LLSKPAEVRRVVPVTRYFFLLILRRRVVFFAVFLAGRRVCFFVAFFRFIAKADPPPYLLRKG
jgi:hypothetical protein